jgi:SAM-dependent methyltransferase
MPGAHPTTRFSDRVENYVLYRPGYPAEAVQTLRSECALRPDHEIADVASGTGIWTRQLLENGNPAFGVEPNAGMRAAAEQMLSSFPRFTSVAGSAEATTLADHSVDYVTVAQAAHWFERDAARREFARILRPGAWLALLWNERLTDSSSFLREYEQMLLTYGTDYNEVRQERTTAAVSQFFSPGFQQREFEMCQSLDYAGLEGRLLSSSYAPGPGHPEHHPMLRALRRMFEAHAVAGRVRFEYLTRLYFGRP